MLTVVALAIAFAQQDLPPLKIDAPETVDVTSAIWTPEVEVHVQRPEKLEGAAAWKVVSAPAGVRAALVSGTTDSARVCLRGFCDAPQSESQIVVEARIGDRRGEAKVTLKRGQARLLLVDDDRSENNLASPSAQLSASDALYRKLLLDGDGLHSLVYDSVAVERYSSGPSLYVMKKYDAILWYTAAEYGGQKDNAIVLSDTDTDNLMGWMGKGKSLAVFSPGYINNIQGFVKVAKSNEEQWTKVEDKFLSDTLGLKGGRGLIHRFNEVDVQTEAGVKFHLAGRKPVEAQISPVNPGHAKPLLFAALDPDKTAVRLVPCAVANASENGTAVYVGFSFENIVENVGEAFRLLVTPAFGWGSQPTAKPANAANAASPETGSETLGDLTFEVPKGWSLERSKDGVNLSPKDLKPDQVLVVTLPPAEAFAGDAAAGFKLVWKTAFTDQGFEGSANPEAGSSKEGWPFSVGAGVIQKGGKAVFALVFAAKTRDKLQAIVSLSDSDKTVSAYGDAINAFFGGLSFKGYQAAPAAGGTPPKGPTAASSDSPWEKAQGVVGVWWGAKTGFTSSGISLVEDQVVFFPDGTYANGLPIQGLDAFDMAAGRRQQPNIWGRYKVDGRRGEVTGLTMKPLKFELNERGALSMEGGSYGRALCPNGLRLNGTFGVEGVPQYSIRFTSAGDFEDRDMLAASDVTNLIPAIHQPGSGTYEIRNFSLILNYSDGRKAKIAFYIKNSTDPKDPSTIYINTIARTKR